MPFGTACGRLRKIIIFNLAEIAKMRDCYRCNVYIDNIDEFTIDHKTGWQHVSPDLFWDFENIAFSHASCNSLAAKKVAACPLKSSYKKGCRCERCRNLKAKQDKRYRDKKLLKKK